MARNARRAAPGDVLSLEGTEMRAAVVTREEGSITLRFDQEGEPFAAALREAGALALPPYIARPSGPTPLDATDYQTVFARAEGCRGRPNRRPALHPRFAGRPGRRRGSPASL